MTTSTSIPVGDAAVGTSVGGNVLSDVGGLGGGDVGGLGGGDVGGLGGGDVGVGGTSVLALTGAGPGTLLLALTGLGALIAGSVAMLTGRRLVTSSDDNSPLRDLSHRADEVAWST